MVLGKTVQPRFSQRNPPFRLSMALVVYMTFRAVWENLNVGLMQSQLSLQRVMQPGYFCSQAARISSRRASAVCSSGAWQIVGKSLLFLSAAYFSVPPSHSRREVRFLYLSPSQAAEWGSDSSR